MKRAVQYTLLLFTLVGPLLAQSPVFQHIVMVIQENRTPDNLFGSNPTFEPGVDIGLTTINKNGVVITATPRPLADCYSPTHNHQNWVVEFDGGKMDGFGLGPFTSSTCSSPPHPEVVYVDNSTGVVQPYFDLAKHFGFANRMFQTNQGPSYPAHQFLLSGTSSPTETSNLFAANNTVGGTGCMASSTAYVALIDPTGLLSSTAYPCFNRSTLVNQLDAMKLTWKYYTIGVQSIWNAPNSIQSICYPLVNGNCTGADWSNVVNNPSQVLTDIQSCNLPNVAWVTPTAANSDHPVTTTNGGPAWVASIVNAVGNSTCGYWRNTAILITWDDWGGFFDHVPPPSLGQPNGWGASYVYGFRVPLLVVSAYTHPGYVDNQTHDFGSMLKFVENNFNLGLIGPGYYADAYADNLEEFFTLRVARPFLPIATSRTAQSFIQSTVSQQIPDDDGDDD